MNRKYDRCPRLKNVAGSKETSAGILSSSCGPAFDVVKVNGIVVTTGSALCQLLVLINKKNRIRIWCCKCNVLKFLLITKLIWQVCNLHIWSRADLSIKEGAKTHDVGRSGSSSGSTRTLTTTDELKEHVDNLLHFQENKAWTYSSISAWFD